MGQGAFFLFLAGFIGLVLVFLTPPFQVPDEPSHFLRAYQVSTGRLYPERLDNGLGGFVPSSLLSAINTIDASGVVCNPSKRIDSGSAFNLFGEPIDESVTRPCVFANYSPLTYMPQAIGIKLASLFYPNPLALLYAGRMANLMFFLLSMYFAIRTIPVQKSVLALIGLMPMTMFLAASVSSDVFTISVSMLFFAVTVGAALNEGPVKFGELVTIILLAMCIGQCKHGAYWPLVGMVLAIPPEKLGGLARFVVFSLCVVFASLIPSLAWFLYIKRLGEGFLIVKQTVGDPLGFILSHPLDYLAIFLRTFYFQFAGLCRMFVGILGWLDTMLPKFVTIAYLLAILTASITHDRRNNYPVGLFQRSIGLLVGVGAIIAVGTGLFIAWPQEDMQVLAGLQGRYFIPLAPYFLFLLCNRMDFQAVRYLTMTIPFVISVTWLVTFVTLYYRYWSNNPTPQIWRWLGVYGFG